MKRYNSIMYKNTVNMQAEKFYVRLPKTERKRKP